MVYPVEPHIRPEEKQSLFIGDTVVEGYLDNEVSRIGNNADWRTPDDDIMDTSFHYSRIPFAAPLCLVVIVTCIYRSKAEAGLSTNNVSPCM